MEIIAATAHPVTANSVQIDRQDARRNFKQRQLTSPSTIALAMNSHFDTPPTNTAVITEDKTTAVSSGGLGSRLK